MVNPVEPGLPRFTGALRPAVDLVAKIKASVHQKLLFGFLIGAVLLVGMAGLSLVVINQMNDRVADLERHQMKADTARQMLYQVTAQSHKRAMALLTGENHYNDDVTAAKAEFNRLLSNLEAIDTDPTDAATFEQLHSAAETYDAAGQQVVAAYDQGNFDKAQQLHIDKEHTLSHVLEDQLLTPLIARAETQMTAAQQAFQSDRNLLTWIVVAFSAVSIVLALTLGYLLSWSFILPVQKVQHALAEMSAGRFRQRLTVANRDEFGSLTRDLNATSEQMANLIEEERRLTLELNESNESLAQASEAKSRFLASVSHELRTPMNAILGFTDALLADVDGPLNPDQRTSLEWVQRGGRDLLELINEILDLSKIEAGKLTIEPESFDPTDLVASIVAQHRSLTAGTGVRLTLEESVTPAVVVLDRQRVRQIIVNLLGNALKFTREGEVNVRLDTDEEWMVITVRDDGPGIAADAQETIFEEFGQVEAALGTGLGLSISRRLARAMGGDISVESEPGHGSLFSLRLPLDCRTTTPAVPNADPLPGDAGERLLLSVDDDLSVAPLLEKMLRGEGYHVVAPSSVGKTVEDARRLQPAAVLLDLLMPDTDGYTILRALKDDPTTAHIPVLVVSVVDAGEAPDEADGYLRKPLRKDALLRALSEHTSSSKAAT
ncbi:MAG: ATP-binding protein [Nocardioidaceae bacterium]